MVLGTLGLNATELSAYCRERGLFSEHVDCWRQSAQNAIAQPLLAMSDQKDLQKWHHVDQRDIKRLKQELRRKEKALAEAAALLLAAKKIQAFWGEAEEDCPRRLIVAVPWRYWMLAGARARKLARLLGVG